MTELKPCPFCGYGAHFIRVFGDPSAVQIACIKCPARQISVLDTEHCREIAAQKWNTRVGEQHD